MSDDRQRTVQLANAETRFSGQGPGVQTSDGCSVELYRRVPYLGEIDLLKSRLRPGMSVLELGCGTGRLTNALLSFGAVVTAVDNSSGMLAHAPSGARLVHSDIEALRLSERFDLVLLASCMINHFDGAVRAAFLRTAKAHIKPNGRFVFQRYDPSWLRSVEDGSVGQVGNVSILVDAVTRSAGAVEMTLKYQEADLVWTHSFAVAPLEENDLQQQLTSAGFGTLEWLDPARLWGSSAPANPANV
jgi:SAM-dependent methyltransferase